MFRSENLGIIHHDRLCSSKPKMYLAKTDIRKTAALNCVPESVLKEKVVKKKRDSSRVSSNHNIVRGEAVGDIS